MTLTATIEQEATVTSEPIGSSMDDQMVLDAIPPTKHLRVNRRRLVMGATLAPLIAASAV